MSLIILMLQCLDVQMLVRLLVNQLVICCILLFVFGWRWKTDVLLNFLSSFLSVIVEMTAMLRGRTCSRRISIPAGRPQTRRLHSEGSAALRALPQEAF